MNLGRSPALPGTVEGTMMRTLEKAGGWAEFHEK